MAEEIYPLSLAAVRHQMDRRIVHLTETGIRQELETLQRVVVWRQHSEKPKKELRDAARSLPAEEQNEVFALPPEDPIALTVIEALRRFLFSHPIPLVDFGYCQPAVQDRLLGARKARKLLRSFQDRLDEWGGNPAEDIQTLVLEKLLKPANAILFPNRKEPANVTTVAEEVNHLHAYLELAVEPRLDYLRTRFIRARQHAAEVAATPAAV